MLYSERSSWWRDNRGWVYIIGAILLFGIIEIRLFSIQVIDRPDFLKVAATNRVRAEVIEPARGRIFDRTGQLLVENRPLYTLCALPWTVKRNPGTIISLASVLETDADQIRRRIGVRGWNTFYPTPLQRDLPFEKLAYLETVKRDYPGFEFRYEAKRSYPHPETVHILGYVGERSQDEARKGRGRFGLIGRKGIELVYEKWLGGEPGVRYQQVDVSGRITGVLTDPPPIDAEPGWDIHLNIDAELQRYACELMEGRTGAVVALDPRNGKLLVLLSLPDYDPSLFAGVMPEDVWNELTTDPGHPLINRAVQGLYPPGSTFKMAILAAAIEEGIADENYSVTCRGGMQLGRRWFKCWNKAGHGTVGRLKSIQQSCDVFYYRLGLALEEDRIEKYCRLFGLGRETGIDLDSESPAIIPSTQYLDRKYGKGKWTRGQLANIGIGQGDVLVTPVQLAVFTAAISTGFLVKPRLAEKLVNPVSGKIYSIDADIKPVKISEKTLKILREGMRMVLNEPGGTAYWLRRDDIIMAGKTGTSQNPHGEDHGLFVGYAPFDDPCIAVAVVVEHGEHGSTSAAPVAVRLMDRYLRVEVESAKKLGSSLH
ncbi:penicillin-binding protein 2 [bacterium]|nr:penicillin-binding protein 2 [bacterium]